METYIAVGVGELLTGVHVNMQRENQLHVTGCGWKRKLPLASSAAIMFCKCFGYGCGVFVLLLKTDGNIRKLFAFGFICRWCPTQFTFLLNLLLRQRAFVLMPRAHGKCKTKLYVAGRGWKRKLRLCQKTADARPLINICMYLVVGGKAYCLWLPPPQSFFAAACGSGAGCGVFVWFLEN